MMEDVGVRSCVRMWTDSNATKAIGSRRGLDKTRHVLIEKSMAPRADQMEKSEDTKNTRSTKSGRSLDEREDVV